jgi:hypothetical protein
MNQIIKLIYQDEPEQNLQPSEVVSSQGINSIDYEKEDESTDDTYSNHVKDIQYEENVKETINDQLVGSQIRSPFMNITFQAVNFTLGNIFCQFLGRKKNFNLIRLKKKRSGNKNNKNFEISKKQTKVTDFIKRKKSIKKENKKN